MKISNKVAGAVLATAAAGLLAVAPAVMADDTTTTLSVACHGVNACKGKSACKTADNSCKGMNSCKGKGIVMVGTADECKNMGGTTDDMTMTPPAS